MANKSEISKKDNLGIGINDEVPPHFGIEAEADSPRENTRG
jgi:hypothetical protein